MVKLPLKVQISCSLAQMHARVADVFKQYSTPGAKSLTLAQFREMLQKMQVKAQCTDDDLRTLCAQGIDAHGNIAASFLLRSFTTWQLEAAPMIGDVDRQRQKVKALRASAAMAQEATKAERAARDEAKRLEAEHSDCSVEVKLGRALAGKQVATVMKEWDSNGDGEVSGGEFLQHVRKSGVVASKKEIYELFKAFDADGSNALEMKELGVFFAKMKAAAEEKNKAEKLVADEVELTVQALRRRSTLTQEALLAEMNAAAEEDKLDHRTEQLDIGARLGKLLLGKNLRGASTVMKTWDKDGTSSVDCDEFILNVRGLGLRATDDELQNLFKNFDADGSGSLELVELKECLCKLQIDATREAEAMEELSKNATALRRRATSLEDARKVGIKELDAMDDAKRVEQAQREREAAVARQQEELAKAAARQAAKASAEEEQRNFEAKIQARRASTGRRNSITA